jgi:hypothetical protein
MLIGATMAALVRGVRGEPILRGVYEGAAGGAAMYAGKRVAAAPVSGAGILGRPVSAIGASMVRNSSLGLPVLSRFVLPLGLVRLYIAPGDEDPVHARLDLAGTLATAYAAFDIDLRFDLEATLSAGAPVFVQQRGVGEARSGAGIVWLTNPGHTDAYGKIFGHERVHVLQYDAGFIAAGEPVERWIFSRMPGGERLGRYVDLGLNLPAWWMLGQLIPYKDRPWEREAYFLSGT